VQGLAINGTEHRVVWPAYTDQEALEAKLASLAEAAPGIASTFSLGSSVQVAPAVQQRCDN
jgi:hypothetical protein